MHKEDSLRFMEDRLRHSHSPIFGDLRLLHRPRVTRRFVAELVQGEGRMLEHVDGTVMVRCESGTLWITHDGDPKDVILISGESYRAERDEAMHVFALRPSVIEIEFEDEVLEH